MGLRRAVSFGAAQTVSSLAVGFLAVKITSVYLGPSGVAILGQLQYFMSMVSSGVADGIRNSAVRRTAELATDESNRAVYIASVLKLLVGVGIPIALIIILLSNWLAIELLHDAKLRAPLVLFGLVYVLGLIGTLMFACSIGAKDYRASALINITFGFVSLALMAVFCITFGLLGGLLAAALAPAASMLIVRWHSRRSAWWPKRVWEFEFSSKDATRALSFVPAATITAIATPLVHILLRDDLAVHSGVATVGLLHGITRLSDTGISVIWGLFGMYFAPRFAEIVVRRDIIHELRRALMFIMPALIGMSIITYLARDTIIALLFTKEFAGMRDLFAWQLTGSCLKLFGGLFGLVMMAKANPYFIGVYEAATLMIWWILGKILIEQNGAVGATQAYALNYAIYSLVVILGTIFVIRRMPAVNTA